MNGQRVSSLSLALAGVALAHSACAQLPSDLQLLVGKKVVVGRTPLCQPNTYAVDLTHAGEAATVISVKPYAMAAKLPASMLERLPAQSRALLEDAGNSATVLFEFKDGKRLDTCAPIGPRMLSDTVELAPGETPPASPPQVAQSATRPAIAGSTLGETVAPQDCPVVVVKLSSSDGGFSHALINALTTSEFERQLDETSHGGVSKHYLDIKLRNASSKDVLGVESVVTYTNRMGDEQASTTLVAQNVRPIRPNQEIRTSYMDRSEWTANGLGQVHLYVQRVRFVDGTAWADNGTRSCTLTATAGE